MGELRKVFFILALVAMGIAFCVEIGSGFLKPPRASPDQLRASIGAELKPGEPQPDLNALVASQEDSPPRPGLAIPAMALLDGLLLFTVALIAASLLIPERVQSRVQGVLTLIVTILVILGALVVIIATVALLLLMVGLFLSPPFGTIAYLVVWGFFDRGGASLTLGLIFFLKLGFAVCLVLAHQRFLQNKGLVLLVLTSLLGNVVVSFLHGLVPSILTSITDAVAAIIVAILAIIWAVVFLVGSLVSIFKAIRIAKPKSRD